MFYILCFMFYVLCFMFYVLCFSNSFASSLKLKYLQIAKMQTFKKNIFFSTYNYGSIVNCMLPIKLSLIPLLKSYEIHQNNQQTTYQSMLHTTVQSNSIHSLSYIYLFVFVLMHFIHVAGGQHHTQQTHNKINFPNIFIFVFYLLFTKLFCSILIILHKKRYFCIYKYKNQYALIAVESR